MLLHLPNDLSPEVLKAVLKIPETVEPIPPADGLPITMEGVVGTLRELRRLGEQESDRQPEFDALCGKDQAWFRTSIDRLRFDTPN
jgi:hypothetical protein